MSGEMFQLATASDGDSDKFDRITGQINIMQSDISELKIGQKQGLDKAGETREGQKKLEGRFDTLEKVILSRSPAPVPVQPVQQQSPLMSQMMKAVLAALGLVATALGIIAFKFSS